MTVGTVAFNSRPRKHNSSSMKVVWVSLAFPGSNASNLAAARVSYEQQAYRTAPGDDLSSRLPPGQHSRLGRSGTWA